MITGRLIDRQGNYYVVLNLKHEDGSRWQKQINLNLPIENNKRRAEARLLELRTEYTYLQQIQNGSPDMLFSGFINDWLEKKVTSISPTTFRGYKHMVGKNITPYFVDMKIRDITYKHIEGYYSHLYDKGLSHTSVHHHHTVLELPVKLTLFYGFRRSEVLGLRWEDVNFEQKTISINQSIVEAIVGGKRVAYEKKSLKGKSSRRTMPLGDIIADLLKYEYEAKRHFGTEYICTDKQGNLINPDEVTHAFRKLLKKNGLRLIRFHDLTAYIRYDAVGRT